MSGFFTGTGPGLGRLGEANFGGAGGSALTGAGGTTGATKGAASSINGMDTNFEMSRSEITSCTTGRSTTFCFRAHASESELKQKLLMLRGIPSVNVAMVSKASGANRVGPSYPA